MAGPRKAARDTSPVSGARVLIVEARFYDDIADALLDGATAALEAAQADIDVLTVDGALEIPQMVAIALRAAEEAGDPFEAVVTLGCVVRGETGHYDIVAGESARALMDLSVAFGLPLGNGILTVETMDQAWARARVSEMNKGGGAAEAALAVLRIKRRLDAETAAALEAEAAMAEEMAEAMLEDQP
jgi:6,7-dimethyl-8-ribityllumazine synthase